MKFPRLLNLRGISGQIAALVVVSIAALHLIVTGIFWLHRPDTPDPAIDRGHSHFLASVELLGKAPSAERPRLIADITRTFPQLDIRLLSPDADTTAVEPDNRVLRTLHRHLGADYRLFGFKGPQHLRAPAGPALERPADDIVAWVYSLSSSAPHLFEDQLDEFNADLHRLLQGASPSGIFSEQPLDTDAFIWRKPLG